MFHLCIKKGHIEKQYQNIVNMNSNYTLQENITTTDRTLIIGGLNSENNT